MERRSIEAVVRALNEAQARYLIAGGLAVIAHGHVRLTVDIDIVLALDPENASRGVTALKRLGYQPTVPVAIEEFADAARRRQWADEKNAVVLRLHSNEHPATPVDLFIQEPFEFDRAYAESLREEVADGLVASFVSFEDLVAMKRAAGRLQDLADIRQLEEVRERLDQERGRNRGPSR